jgi:hypothetical protein
MTVITTSDSHGRVNRKMPGSSAEITTDRAYAKTTPMPRPMIVPRMAMIIDSPMIVLRSWRRDMPTARSRPSSRVRSSTDSDRVLAMPIRAMITARPSRP